MKKTTIFLDLDGVIFNLAKALKERYDYNLDSDNNNKLLYKELFPDFVKNNGYENLELLPKAKELVKILLKNKYPVAILTSTGYFYKPISEVARQKKAAIDKHFPKLIDIPFITVTSGVNKAFFAKNDTLLIDDKQNNIDHFLEKGGLAELYTEDRFDEIIQTVLEQP